MLLSLYKIRQECSKIKGVKIMKRRTAREKAMQTLFQVDVSELNWKEALNHVLDGNDTDEFLEQLVQGTITNQDKIDAILRDHLANWTLDRIGNVDRSILRLALYEIQFVEEIPQNVSVNEAIELAKTFGDDQSSKFVNGVLSRVIENK
jgi:transcription antitermination protein NusB